jgi:flagellum-specific peptidoglycan hydrolase FlgJ
LTNSFIEQIAPYAQELGKKYNILPSVLIAQACLESNFGASELATKAHNLFGVKEFGNGPSVLLPTTEFRNGVKYNVYAKFKKYDTWKESLEDLCQLYQNGVSWDRNKYKKVIGQTNYKQTCQAIQQCGYCTDPQYANKLIQIIEKYGLTKYDQQPKPQARYVIVKPGDTLIKLFGARYKEIAAKNGIKNPDDIKVGQKIYF